MSHILFLCIPSHGHVNPVIGLAGELINQGERITFFCSDEFKKSIEGIGADFKCYKEDLNIFQKKNGTPDEKPTSGLVSALLEPMKFIDDILVQIKNLEFDYIVFSSAYPYANVISQILDIPTVSSFAVFMTLKDLMAKKAEDPSTAGKQGFMGINAETTEIFKKVRQDLIQKYQVEIPDNMMDLFFNKGDLNIIYTSKYFVPDPDQYDDSFIFIGPPVYNKKYALDFPFEKLKGKKVVYISLGTVFSNHSDEINNIFFKTFADLDVVVVMAAYNIDLSRFNVPANFIVRNYVPQLKVLKYTSVAITHAGMNSIGDILYNNVPFISIPLGADQFFLANRAQELGATLVLDANNLTPEILKKSVEKVIENPNYLENIKKISNSFIESGGYKRAVEEIFKLKKRKGISN
ncbi:macrolide family glycosyltransferase [Pedobacter nototheniae]|uniref:macrolide family glycosyltransferase n=1 Tax=Pedobacter nototheniae TaxID=2488994 RepID=UPI00292D8E3C|nr:macrolide family glycosyltransferase [Pedobacter nototheniae]